MTSICGTIDHHSSILITNKRNAHSIDMIKIYDNFLGESEFNKIYSIITGGSIPLYCSRAIDEEYSNEYVLDSKWNFQLVHIFYNHRDQFNVNPNINLLAFLLEKLRVEVLLRAKLNINPCTEKIITHGYHRDLTHVPKRLENIAMTAVYYINDNDGYTVFADGTRVESVANRIVIFPSNISHSGTTCTNQSFRAVINLNFIQSDDI